MMDSQLDTRFSVSTSGPFANLKVARICLLVSLPVFMLFTCSNWRTVARILIKFVIGERYWHFWPTYSIFGNNKTTIMDTLHEDRYVSLSAEVTGWRILMWSIPSQSPTQPRLWRQCCNLQRSKVKYYCAGSVTRCVNFLIYLFSVTRYLKSNAGIEVRKLTSNELPLST
jgi:hypothetical protein